MHIIYYDYHIEYPDDLEIGGKICILNEKLMINC